MKLNRLAFGVALIALATLSTGGATHAVAAIPASKHRNAQTHRPAARRPAARRIISYAAAAGNIPAGHFRGAEFDAVLPSGRIVTPAGTSVLTGMNALGVALTPDGRFAIVSNDDEREGAVHSITDPSATGGFSLAVVDTATMRVVDRYHAAGEKFWVGLLAVADPAQGGRTLVLASGGPTNTVYAFTLDANGHLSPDARHTIGIPGPADPAFGDAGHSFPGTLVAAPRRSARVRRRRRRNGGQRDRSGGPHGRRIAGERRLLSVRRGARRESPDRHRRRADALREAAAAGRRAGVPHAAGGLTPRLGAVVHRRHHRRRSRSARASHTAVHAGRPAARRRAGWDAHGRRRPPDRDRRHARQRLRLRRDDQRRPDRDGAARREPARRRRHGVAPVRPRTVRHAAGRARALARRRAALRRVGRAQRRRRDRRARSGAAAPARFDSDRLVPDRARALAGRSHALRREHERLRPRSGLHRRSEHLRRFQRGLVDACSGSTSRRSSCRKPRCERSPTRAAW